MGSNDVRATKDKTVVAAQSISELNDDSDPSCPYTFSLLAQQDDDNFRLSKIISQVPDFLKLFGKISICLLKYQTSLSL